MTSQIFRRISLCLYIIATSLSAYGEDGCVARALMVSNDDLRIRCVSSSSVRISSGQPIANPILSLGGQFVVFLAGSPALSSLTIAKASQNWRPGPLASFVRLPPELLHREVQALCISTDGSFLYVLMDFSATSFYLVGIDIKRNDVVAFGPAAAFAEVLHGPYKGNLVLERREPTSGDPLGRVVAYVYNRFSRDGKLRAHLGGEKDQVDKTLHQELKYYP